MIKAHVELSFAVLLNHINKMIEVTAVLVRPRNKCTIVCFKILTTLVWTIPGDTHNTLIPASAGSRLKRTLLNITCNKNTNPFFIHNFKIKVNQAIHF